MAVGSVPPLQRFARAPPGRRTAELVLPQPFVPAATRWGPQAVVLYRGQAEGWEKQDFQPGLPASLRSRGLWGRWCQLGGGCRTPPHQPVCPAESSSPEPPVPLAQSTGVPSLGIPWWPWLCVPRDTASPVGHTDHSLAPPELASLPSCLGTHQPHSSHALEQSRSNICPSAGPGWFCSWHCCSSSAEEKVGGNFCLATAAAAAWNSPR